MKGFLWRHKTLLIIWIVVFAIVGYTAYLLFFKSSAGENPYVSNSSQSTVESDAKEDLKNLPKDAEVGEAALDSDLEFTVNGETCDKNERTIGENQYAMAEAEGSFCRVNVTIKNVGSKHADLPLSVQKGFSGGASYPPDEDATQYAQADQTKNYWYLQIPPGQTVSGDLVFDRNGANKIIKIELHAMNNSPGLTVSIPNPIEKN